MTRPADKPDQLRISVALVNPATITSNLGAHSKMGNDCNPALYFAQGKSKTIGDSHASPPIGELARRTRTGAAPARSSAPSISNSKERTSASGVGGMKNAAISAGAATSIVAAREAALAVAAA